MPTDKIYPRLNIRLSAELETRIKEESKQQDVSRGWVVRQALKQYFNINT